MRSFDHIMVECPKCANRFTVGEGRPDKKRQAAMLRSLLDQGYSFREVGRLFNMSPGSIKFAVDKYAPKQKEEL